MMRPIKFRVAIKKDTAEIYDVTKLIYSYGVLVGVEFQKFPPSFERYYWHEDLPIWKKSPPILIQSTGLLDCEDKEIWEGDIIFINAEPNDNGDCGTLYLVKFLDAAFWGVGLDHCEDDKELLCELNDSCKIVDNIFESPELLEVE